jgi:hypothetical protein
MNHRTCSLASILLLTLILSTSAQAVPSIGLYFDTDATSTVSTYNLLMPKDCYICILDADMMFQGAAFRLVVPSNVVIAGTEYPPGLPIGAINLGVEIGLSDPIPGWDVAVVLAQLQLLVTSGSEVLMEVVAHDKYSTVIVADNQANLHEATGMSSSMTTGAPAETSTWGEVKSMFQ